MVTSKKDEPPRFRVYLDEWMIHLHVPDVIIAKSLGVARETVWKWKHRQTLKIDAIARIASLLEIEPIELLSPPWRPSIDAKLVNASDDLVRKVGEIAETLLKTS
jgi:hypothetical protein